MLDEAIEYLKQLQLQVQVIFLLQSVLLDHSSYIVFSYSENIVLHDFYAFYLSF